MRMEKQMKAIVIFRERASIERVTDGIEFGSILGKIPSTLKAQVEVLEREQFPVRGQEAIFERLDEVLPVGRREESGPDTKPPSFCVVLL